MSEIIEHALGVHLNQRHSDYIADIGLGYSAIKDLVKSAPEFWWHSPWNPLRPPEEEKAAYQRGDALHLKFESPRVYARTYGVRPSLETMPGTIDLVRDLQEAYRRHFRSERAPTDKETLIRDLIKHKAPVHLLRVEQVKFDRRGAKHLDPAVHAVIEMLHRMAMMTTQQWKLPKGSLTIREALRGGLNEVSVYWVDEDGIRQRARFDKLKPNITIDLKGLTDWKRNDFKLSLLKEVILRGYVIQWAHYDEGRRQLRKAVAEGRVFGGTKEQLRRLEEIAKAEEWAWGWIFAKLDGAPQLRTILRTTSEGDPQYEEAVQQRFQALTNFTFYREQFGMEEMWFDNQVVWEPEHNDWPTFSVYGEA
jgi:hypothetical protein